MECYIVYIHDRNSLVKKQIIIDGDNQTVGDYIKKNIKEMYHIYLVIALNIAKIDKDLNELELAVKKSYCETFPYVYKATSRSRECFIKNITKNTKDIDASELIKYINNSHHGNDSVKVINYKKNYGKQSSIYEHIIEE